MALFLASDEASYITGQTIYPDGGRLALNYTVAVPEELQHCSGGQSATCPLSTSAGGDRLPSGGHD